MEPNRGPRRLAPRRAPDARRSIVTPPARRRTPQSRRRTRRPAALQTPSGAAPLSRARRPNTPTTALILESNRSPRGGAVAQRLRGRLTLTSADRHALPLCLRHLPLRGRNREGSEIAPPAGGRGSWRTTAPPRGERFCRPATRPVGSASSACPRRDASAPAPRAPCPSPGRAAAARAAPAYRAAG